MTSLKDWQTQASFDGEQSRRLRCYFVHFGPIIAQYSISMIDGSASGCQCWLILCTCINLRISVALYHSFIHSLSSRWHVRFCLCQMSCLPHWNLNRITFTMSRVKSNATPTCMINGTYCPLTMHISRTYAILYTHIYDQCCWANNS